jgi:hypothetical protein
MKKAKSRIRKIFIIVVATLAVLVGLTLSILSPLAKYLLEKHDLALIGRELKIDWAYVNPFTGYAHLSNVRIYEQAGDSIFISAKGASAYFDMSSLFHQEVKMTQLTVDQPWGKIVQRKKKLNFDDIIRKFTGDPDKPSRSRWHCTLLTTRIVDGEFHYIEKIIPINYSIKHLTIEGPGKTPDVDTISAKFYFQEGKGKGDVKGDFTINQKTADYRLAVVVNDFDLEIIRQYIWELINYGMFRARLDADVHARGNFKSQDSLVAKGRLALRNFHLGKTNEDDYLSFRKLQFVIEELSPVRRKYLFDSVIWSTPYLKFEKYDSLDNIQLMFGRKGSNVSDVTRQPGRFNLVIEIARYIKVLSRNFFRSEYKIGRLRVLDGTFKFSDYSLSEKFTTEITPLTIRADSVNNNHKRVGVTFKSAIKPFGNANLFISINPKDSGDFDMRYTFEKIPAPVFNPYLITYTSFPLDRGTIELKGLWNVRKGEIKSNNHVVIIDPRVTKRIRNKATRWIPMPLIMSFIRDRGNVIDYEIPITGNMKSPKFHLHDVVVDVLKNIFVKPPTTPYRVEVKSVENEIEKALTVKWEMCQRDLRPQQERFVKKISQFLKDNPHSTLAVQPIEYAAKEKEYILFYETKKKYYLITHNKSSREFTREDSIEVSKMSIKDEGLVKHISRNLSDTVMFTLQERCARFVGNAVVDSHLQRLVKGRVETFRKFFVQDGTADQVIIKPTETSIPYNGFSYFKLAYPGELPRNLRKAYEKMNDLNDEGPRKKYFDRRRKEAEVLKRTEGL